jgi:hypothetical protein
MIFGSNVLLAGIADNAKPKFEVLGTRLTIGKFAADIPSTAHPLRAMLQLRNYGIWHARNRLSDQSLVASGYTPRLQSNATQKPALFCCIRVELV